jgi:hypothetical protein
MISAIVAGVSAPVALVVRAIYKRDGQARNAQSRCALCNSDFADDDGEMFCADGVFVCEPCAAQQKRRWTFVLPAMVLGVVAVGVMSAVGLLLGGPVTWSFMGWEIPTLVVGLLPVTILGTGVAMRLGLGKKANQSLLSPGDPQDLLLAGANDLGAKDDR